MPFTEFMLAFHRLLQYLENIFTIYLRIQVKR